MQSNLGSSSGLEFKRPDLDLLFRVAPLLSKWMNRRKPLFRATNHARNQSWTALSFAFDLIVPPCKIIYAGITDSHNSLCALDSRGWSRDKWKLSLWSFRKICLNKKKEKKRFERCLDVWIMEISILTFYRSLWKDGIYTEGSKVECDGWSTVRRLFVRFLILRQLFNRSMFNEEGKRSCFLILLWIFQR